MQYPHLPRQPEQQDGERQCEEYLQHDDVWKRLNHDSAYFPV